MAHRTYLTLRSLKCQLVLEGKNKVIHATQLQTLHSSQTKLHVAIQSSGDQADGEEDRENVGTAPTAGCGKSGSSIMLGTRASQDSE